ncbi:VOC family protein [Streptomyces sp. SID3343]|uniref:VOC family protein n=1 Tax=Streptomyces sp. SID3343 TaxID=2690260 RepID=UPI001369D5D8|nr:VOC family protein [Streptomyces sp. SID3343]MYW03154.1 glyoxalase [Streptomyces sp. SID3343]
MATMIFVNLPVKNLGKATEFYTALGFTPNPQFSDGNASSFAISETIHLMVLAEPFFKGFTTKEIADATKTTESIVCLSADSREGVDELVEKAFAAGGKPSNKPLDEGFMYGRSFQDLDGHLWEVMYMDMSAMPAQG